MIAIEHVAKHFETVTALSDVSLYVETGQTIAVVGPSGSGKTTLLRLIAGLEAPDRGEIRLGDQAVSRPDWVLPPGQRHVGYVFQAPTLWPHMTVMQNILFGLSAWPHDAARKRLDQLLAEMNLEGLEKRYPHQLSGGEARRVSLARSLAPNTPYLLLDEPFTNVDTALKDALLTLTRDHIRQHNVTTLFVSHDSAEAEALAQRIVQLKSGRLQPSDEA